MADVQILMAPLDKIYNPLCLIQNKCFPTSLNSLHLKSENKNSSAEG